MAEKSDRIEKTETSDAAPGLLRTFVAVELPPPILAALTEVQMALAERLARVGVTRGVRWVNPAGIHLTLKFLGGTESGLLPEIEARLATALGAGRPLALDLAGLGVFPSPRAPRVLWVGLAGEVAGLAALQSLVEAAISPLGYPTERRPFSPHLTLGRVADSASPAERRAIGEAIASAGLTPTGRFAVAEVSLMRSELSRAGARYSRLFAIRLSS